MFSCYFLKCPYHHHLSPPITRHAFAREPRASSFHFSGCGLPTASLLSSTSSVGGVTPGGRGTSAGWDGTGGGQRDDSSGEPRKRRDGREVRSGRVSWYLDGDSPSNGRVSARHSSSTMSRSCPATITVASEPLISPSRGCVVSLFQIFGFLSRQPQPPTRFPTNWDFRDPLASVHIDARVFNRARASYKLAHGRSSSVQSGCDLDPRVHVPNPPRSVLIARCPRSN